MIDEIDEDEIKDLPKFLKRILKTGGYLPLFVQLGFFPEDFVQSRLEVMGSLYTIL